MQVILKKMPLMWILGVSLATLCNYVNNIAETPINPELQAFA